MRPYWPVTEALAPGDMACLGPDGKRLALARGEPAETARIDITGHGPMATIDLVNSLAALAAGVAVALTENGRAVAYLVPAPEGPG